MAPPITAASPEWDDIDRKAPLPEDAIRVLGGTTSTQMHWRLYVFRNSLKQTCLQWFEKTLTGHGGPWARCDYKSPVDTGGANGSDGRFLFGPVSGTIVKIRVEYVGGGSKTFNTVGVTDYGERFWAGEVSRAPLKRVVGLDTAGREVGERTDFEGY